MKKLFVVLLTLILCALILTSCRFKPDDAADVMEKIDEKMTSLKSYQCDMSVELMTTMQGVTLDANFDGQIIQLENYYYELMEGSITVKEPSEKTIKSKSLEAFHDGKMFVWTELDQIKQKVFSPLSAEEYRQYREKQNDNLDIDFNACVNSSFVRNEDKTWTLEYSGYTKKVIDEVIAEFGNDLLEEEIVDMKITFNANKDFTAKDMKFEMIFEESASSSRFCIYAQFSKYNEAVAITDTLNSDDYTKILDCRLLKDIEKMLEDIENAEQGSFALDVDQNFKLGVTNQNSSEKDAVNYGIKDGKYYYTIQASSNGSQVNITYENGTQTVTVNGSSQITSQTEKEAKAFINGLINTACYDPSRVSKINQIEAGVYRIEVIEPDENLYSPIFTALSASPSLKSQDITITIRDDKIIKIESSVLAEGSSSFGHIKFKLNSDIEFDHSGNTEVHETI